MKNVRFKIIGSILGLAFAAWILYLLYSFGLKHGRSWEARMLMLSAMGPIMGFLVVWIFFGRDIQNGKFLNDED